LAIAGVAILAAIYRWQLGVEGSAWMRYWGLIPARLWQDGASNQEFLRLFSAIFVHVDVWHLFGNLAFLALFAPRIEARIGGLQALAMYLFCGALANGLAALKEPDSLAPIVGASGVVSALLGAFLVLFPGARIGLILPLGLYWQIIRVPALTLIGGWFALQLMYTFWMPALGTVAWWTHIAGFLGGLVLAAPARWYRHPPGREYR
jgi:membrane associated rhomboid family serine protease